MQPVLNRLFFCAFRNAPLEQTLISKKIQGYSTNFPSELYT
ncbi:hypothetical protein KNP414_04320 [Paenibacillus mucilaginosus KNP414]|uniref:Uncharacterized protein n=1 Tax=Paenibacillus mucilaginosus (strain KNP414) TaxID=1036673 RepID=F8FJK2_PAEMK|nr:hypothetical protein KNP414_04320 [Paenibacillus mucilaginosus KNP414]